jgi:hypothetical protein
MACPLFVVAQLSSGCASSSPGEGAPSQNTGDCQIACPRAQAASCPNEQPQSECEQECTYAVTVAPACRAENAAFFACAAKADYQCNSLGQAGAVGCASEAGAVSDCVSGKSDAGASD